MKLTEILCLDIQKHLNGSTGSSINGCLNKMKIRTCLMDQQASGGLCM